MMLPREAAAVAQVVETVVETPVETVVETPVETVVETPVGTVLEMLPPMAQPTAEEAVHKVTELGRAMAPSPVN